MTFKRFSAVLLLAAMLFTVVACAPKNPDNEITSGSDDLTEEPITQPESLPETSPEELEKKLVLFENGKWNYRLVTRTIRSTAEVDFSFALVQTMSTLTGVTINSANDTAIKPDEVYEIIIGYTTHPVMRSLYKTLGYGEAKIKVVGNKILIAAYTDAGFDLLYEHLNKVFMSGYSGGKLEFKVQDVETVLVYDESLNSIPVVSAAPFSTISDCGLNQTLIIHSDATQQIFNYYINSYSSYECVSKVYDSGNCFATFDFGSDLINVSYSNGDQCLRIIHNKNTEPTGLFKQPAEVKQVCEPMIILHGLAWESSGYQNGLCILIRLTDGRFIVIDGGFSRQKDADDLYELLKNNTPDGMEKPVIAGWVITHAHSDHHSTFATKFVVSYRNSVVVENVIFNPPYGDIYNGESISGLLAGQQRIIACISVYNANFVRPHVGDRYYFGDAVMDMLYTVDYQHPEKFSYYNMSSVIFSLKIAGQRIIITGDGANSSFDKMVAMYGDSLKADIVQVAHHGYGTGASANASTGVIQGYKYMSPSLVLWPIGKEGFESVQNAVYNVALKTLPSVKKIIVAEGSDHIVMLPFKG